MNYQQLDKCMQDLSVGPEQSSHQASRQPPKLNGRQFSGGQDKQNYGGMTSSNQRPTRPNPRHSRSVSRGPRSFEELHNERSYLMVNLQRLDERTKSMMASLLRVQERVNPINGPIEARKLRKQAGRLRSDLAGVERQEKYILSRLSDLYIEIQSRERWCQVQQRFSWQPQTPQIFVSHQLMSPVSPITPLPHGWYQPGPISMASPTLLSPMSPEFVPGALQFRDPNWGENGGDTWGEESPNYSPGWPGEEHCDTRNDDIPHELYGWVSNSSNNSRSMSTPTPSLPHTPERRMSLPTLDATYSLE